MPSRFRGLVAYQRVAALSDELHAAVKRWDVLDRRTSGPQLLRAIDSVGANITASSGRWKVAEKRQFLIVREVRCSKRSTGSRGSRRAV